MYVWICAEWVSFRALANRRSLATPAVFDCAPGRSGSRGRAAVTYQPGTPPGWYPTGVGDQLRWWDGYQWTSHVSPALTPSAPVPATSLATLPAKEPEPEVASRTLASWLLAFFPLVLGLMTVLLAISDLEPGPAFAVLGLFSLLLVPAGVGLGLWDIATLRARGSNLSQAHALWVFLGGWVYLLIRAILIKSQDREQWLVLGVNVLTAMITGFVALAGFYNILNTPEVRRAIFYDQGYMERQIESGVKQDSGRIVQVECPEEPPVGEGLSFDCAINNMTGARVGTAIITWDNNFGWFSWTTNRDTFTVDQA